VGIVVYVAVLVLLRSDEIAMAVDPIRRRLKR
jgi:hypothetical protein